MIHNLVLRFRAPDRPGILAAILPWLAAQGCDIRAASVEGLPDTQTFLGRIELASLQEADGLERGMASLAEPLGLECEWQDLDRKMPVLIAVSKFGHCLSDLIVKTRNGQLPITIVGVVSNHETMRDLVEWHSLPYHHLSMGEGKAAQEAQFQSIIVQTGAELTVLARYMQVLSDPFAGWLDGRCINIHHSFLPSFKGARPYHQAYAKGVKLIGATAHFVTADLDEGPIIEQDVRRVHHRVNAEQMVEIGREIEASVLSRAVGWYAQHRIFRNGNKTVVF